jgi:hypothetical protein
MIELLKAVFSMRSVPEYYVYKHYKSRVYLVVRQSPSSKDVNAEVKRSTALAAVPKQRLVKRQQIEKN